MSDVLSKQKVAVASVHHSKLDKSGTHITTGNWLTAMPVGYWHMIPKEHIKGKCNINCNLAPIAVPTYGRARINLRYFFVPYRVVFPNSTEFFVDTIASNYSASGIVSQGPTITNDTIESYFLDYNDPVLWKLLDEVVQPDPANPTLAYDIYHSGNQKFYKFTVLGRKRYNILLRLGYKVGWNGAKDEFSALALLAYAKLYLDWYSNSQYMDSYSFLYIDRLTKYDNPSSYLKLTSADLDVILGYTGVVCYDGQNEVFTNAWDTPVAPNSGNVSMDFLFNDISMSDAARSSSVSNRYLSGMYNSQSGTPVIQGDTDGYGGYPNSTSTINISQYAIDALKLLTDYVKRHQLSGARAVDRYLADFGVNLDSAKVNRSIFVSTQSQDVEIGTVVSTADTAAQGEDSNLGDYSGFGRSRGESGFDFTADEFGVLIAVATILPSGGYVQGIDRHNLHLTKLDFFNPTFDNLSVQAITKKEVYISRDGRFGTESQYNEAFGYAPRYYEYKVGRNWLSGDMVFPATDAGADSWNLFRLFDDDTFGGSAANLVHSLNFTRGEDRESYDRIFINTTNSNDKFRLVLHFDVASEAPCKSLFDSYDFEDEKNKITMQSNGTKFN